MNLLISSSHRPGWVLALHRLRRFHEQPRNNQKIGLVGVYCCGFSHAFSSYEVWDRIVVGTVTIPYERVDLHVMYGSVTLQLSVTSLNIGMNATKEYSAVMTLNCTLTLFGHH